MNVKRAWRSGLLRLMRLKRFDDVLSQVVRRAYREKDSKEGLFGQIFYQYVFFSIAVFCAHARVAWRR